MPRLSICFILLLLAEKISSHISSFNDTSLIESLKQAMIYYINNATQTVSLSPECATAIKEGYLENTVFATFNLNKLIKDSSINQNDITSYGQCMHRRHGFTQFNVTSNFLLSSVKTKINSTLMFGICAVKGCNNEEYINLITNIGKHLGYIDEEQMDLNLTSISDYKEDYYSIYDRTYINFLPCSLLIIHFMMMIFNKCSYQLAKKLFAMKEEFTKGNKFGSNLKKIFSVRANWGELIDLQMTNSGINNDSGITYIQGIRGVFMILIVYGFFLLNLNNAPVAVITEFKKNSVMSNWFYSFFYCALRFAPKILYSCSGFCLGYKLLCYLDECVEDEMQHSEKEKTTNVLQMDETNENEIEDRSNSITYLLDGSALDRAKALNKNLSIKHAFIFIFRQIHKYIMMIFTFLFVLYTLYYVVVFIKGIQPTWVYFQNHINTGDCIYDIIFAVTLTGGFALQKVDDAKISFYFCMIYNEFIYFILGTLIIYLGYKHKFRVDSLFLFMILLMFIGKVTFYCVSNYEAYKYDELLNFATFEVSTYYNFIYFLIGAYFSFGNYTIQKGIVNYEDAEQQQKPYLFIFVKCIKTFKRMKKGCLFIFGAILFLINFILCFGYKLLTASSFFKGKYSSLYLLFDTEFFVLFSHLYALIFYIKGDNVINPFLTLPIWSYFSKIYFTFIMFLNTVIVFVIYQSETRIKFDLWTMIFYSTLCLLMNFVFSTFVYIFFELPYKRLVKIVFSKKSIEDNIKIIDKGVDFSSSNIS